MKPSAAIGNPTAYWSYRETGRRSAPPPRAWKSRHGTSLSNVRIPRVTELSEFIWKWLLGRTIAALRLSGDGVGGLDMARRNPMTRRRARDHFRTGGEQQ